MTEISRRTAVTAAAWSIPVVVMAVASPARATSNTVYDIQGPYAGWNVDGLFGLEAFIYVSGVPTADVPVKFVLNPGSLEFNTTTYGTSGYCNLYPIVPDDVTTATITAGDATVTIPITGTPGGEPT